MAIVRVIIESENEKHSYSYHLSDGLVKEAFHKIDRPNAEVHPYVRALCCTLPGKIDKIELARQMLCNLLAAKVNNSFLQACRQKDTVVGKPEHKVAE